MQGHKVSFKNASTSVVKGRHNSIGLIVADDESSASFAGLKSLIMEELEAYVIFVVN